MDVVISIISNILRSNFVISDAILGSFLGAVLGALGAFFVSYYNRNRDSELSKIATNKNLIRSDGVACTLAHAVLLGLAVKNAVNMYATDDLKKGIYNEEKTGLVFCINLLTEYDKTPEITKDFINTEIMANWNSLIQEIQLQNGNISSFNEYYKQLRAVVHTQVFTSKQGALNRQALDSDNTMIIEAIQDQRQANESFRNRCIMFIALLKCYVEYLNSFDLIDSTSLSEHREAINKLVSYKPNKKILDEEYKKLDVEYAVEKMFKSKKV